MSRRGTAGKKTAKSDPIYRNRLVNMLVNRILKHGKKIIGLSNYLSSREKDSTEDRNKSTIRFLRQAIRGVTPGIVVKSRRVGGLTHQVPIEIGSTQGKALAIRWLLGAFRKRPVDPAKGCGDAIRKKEETHKMAEANIAFVHFR
ncbi:unnamed protein product [Spirodela intermedia]|uniref:Small ribosomal subunit protein uS7 domain-containing protein n=1 Tax=Spirodela intermedia TaxID=51605 RepID=A0A7I8K2K8_SPIIN|nr:unnamed protein product [Spirodela intermedia]